MSLANNSRAARSIAIRELRRFFRQKSRALSTFARPLFWLFVVGPGFGRYLARGDAGPSYQQFLFPGVLGIVVLFGSILSALSTVSDRELGSVRAMLIAPIPRSTIVIGKVLGGALLASLQALLILLLAPLLSLPLNATQVFSLIGCLLLTSIAIASLGMMLASRIDSLENFSAIMNFVIFPMFFLSGGLYQVKLLPEPLRILVSLNPLTYGIDLFKHVLLNAAEFPPVLDVAVLLIVSAIAAAGATLLFDKESKLMRAAKVR
jgi:ABC-2 type transport system permease protein